jgi:predicted metal-dependent hydrolase
MSSPWPITARRPSFSFPDRLDPLIVEGQPEVSFPIIGMSLVLPYLEPYLIRTMRAARQQITDPALARDLDAFNEQEGQHYRQHRRFNEAVRGPAAAAIGALEAEVDADYRRWSATRSLRWNLAYAEGFEAYTGALAHFSFESGLIDRLVPPARVLFEWHLLEELEHRTVAFDVYEHLRGGYLRRLAIGRFAQWHLDRFARRVAAALANADPGAFRARWGGRADAWTRVRPLVGQALRSLLPAVLRTYLPWYTPHRIPAPEGTRERLARYG